MPRHLLTVATVLTVAISLQAQDQPTQRFTIPALVREMSPGVVHIAALNASGKSTGFGSGFVIESSGTIITAYHVIRGAAGAMVKTADGEIYDRIDVVQYDLRRDIVVLKIKPFRPLKALRLANDDELVVGEDAAAIGNPQGLEATVSGGIISGYRQAEGYRLVQTTVPISPGSSGGPLFNLNGGVVGMVTSYVDNAQGQNLNFAVPIVYIRTLLNSEAQAAPLPEFTKRVAASPPSGLQPSASVDTSSAGWMVAHAHRNFSMTCSGTLSVNKGRVIFASDNPDHSWDVSATNIAEAKMNASVGRSLSAFHIRLRSGTNQDFVYVDGKGSAQNPGPIIDAIAAAMRGL
jgi:hypothetical protein